MTVPLSWLVTSTEIVGHEAASAEVQFAGPFRLRNRHRSGGPAVPGHLFIGSVHQRGPRGRAASGEESVDRAGEACEQAVRLPRGEFLRELLMPHPQPPQLGLQPFYLARGGLDAVGGAVPLLHRGSHLPDRLVPFGHQGSHCVCMLHIAGRRSRDLAVQFAFANRGATRPSPLLDGIPGERRGVLGKYAALVASASEGAVTDKNL